VQTFPRIPDEWTRGERRAPPVYDDVPQPPAPRRSAESETRIEVEPQADRAPADRAPASHASAASSVESQSDYDIEAELADAIADDLDTRSFTRSRKPRKPVGTVRMGNETVVVCDDGSTWRRIDRGWRQVTPLPGTPVQLRENRIERAG
jgi:hypothetical protein